MSLKKKTNKIMKLYELPKGAKIKVETTDNKKVIVIFDHIDGAYSYCYSADNTGKILHLSACTPLIKKGKYYEIQYED